MAKDPTQGPVSTYDEFGNPIQTNVDPPVVEEVAKEEVAESAVEETTVEEVVDDSTEAEGIDVAAEPASDDIKTYAKAPESEEALEGEEIIRAEVGDTTEKKPKAEESADEEDEFVSHEHEITTPVTRDEAETMLKERSFLEMEEMAVADGLIPESSEINIVRQLLDHWFPPPPEEFVTHEHEIKAPLTYNEAETMLKESSFLEMREMAIADGLTPERSRVKVTYQLLAHWFPPSEAGSVGSAEEPEMSVRVRRAKGLM